MAQPVVDGYAKLTIVLPTFNEADNIRSIVPVLFSLYPAAHIIVVDDSSRDGTAAAVEEMTKRYPGLRLIVRKNVSRGLTASVMEGVLAVQTPYFINMDADFQHPPESVADLYAALDGGADFVIGARRTMGPLTFTRRVASQGAHKLASLYLWFRRQPGSSDLMSGFFGGRTDVVRDVIVRKGDKFERKGFKVLFDVLKFLPKDKKRAEVDYTFGDRTKGQSKLGGQVVLSVMKQCGPVGKGTGFFLEFFLINPAGRVVGLLILAAIFMVAVLMTGAPPPKP
ncbi:MAG TPA: glycosyltransferase [Methanomassiliicoccales archaeon]|nr:glycosyltransferase [Methanomassiliicoccales archaeon]